MTAYPELQRACAACVALDAAEVATLQAFLTDPASDRLRDALSMLRLERARKQSEIACLMESVSVEHFEKKGEEP